MEKRTDILVVGSGGRAHAMIKRLRESRGVGKLYACPGNGGIMVDAQCVALEPQNIRGITAFAKKSGVELVVVTPDEPLLLGISDALAAAGIKVFGPTASAAELEGSKAFAKDFMKKYGVPTSDYGVFHDGGEAMEYVRGRGAYPVVIKGDGIGFGRGVIIARDEKEAAAAIRLMIGKQGPKTPTILVEEYLEGDEITVYAFTDSKTIAPAVSAMEHKRAYDGDRGLVTGGMGAVAPHPLYTQELAKRCEHEIFLPTIQGMNREGRPYAGCLCFSLMLTKEGPRVIEYNCRFGDPEAQAVLPLLKSDLLEVLLAVAEKRLSQVKVEWKKECSACVVLASGGYPLSFRKGYPIRGLNEDGQLDAAVSVYHAATLWKDGELVTDGGRVLGISACGGTIQKALDKAYHAAEKVSFQDFFYRHDLGLPYLGEKKG